MKEHKINWDRIKIESVWDAVTHFNHCDEWVRLRSMEYLLDYFHWDLVHKFNEDKPEDEQYNGTDYNDRFIQFAIDELNYLFQKH